MTFKQKFRNSVPVTITVLLISGCSTMGSMYSSCDQKNSSFTEVATCTKVALKGDHRYGFHNGYISYVNRAVAALEVTEEQVANGAVSEKAARYRMQEIFASMEREISADVDAAIRAIPTKSTVRTTCTTYGSNTNCTSR